MLQIVYTNTFIVVYLKAKIREKLIALPGHRFNKQQYIMNSLKPAEKAS